MANNKVNPNGTIETNVTVTKPGHVVDKTRTFSDGTSAISYLENVEVRFDKNSYDTLRAIGANVREGGHENAFTGTKYVSSGGLPFEIDVQVRDDETGKIVEEHSDMISADIPAGTQATAVWKVRNYKNGAHPTKPGVTQWIELIKMVISSSDLDKAVTVLESEAADEDARWAKVFSKK